jgi:uncharacterized protein (DUF58 family)
MWPFLNKKSRPVSEAPSPTAPTTTPARFLDPELLARIGSLELLARAVVEGFMSGLHRSPFTGFSTEFTEYRQYNQGDDLRYLDWRLLGRTDRYFIKKYRADTNTQCHLLVDTSASMRYSHAGKVTKLQYAQFLSASLAYLLGRQQDSVGLVAFDQLVHPCRRAIVLAICRRSSVDSRCWKPEVRRARGITPPTGRTATRRGIVVLISDFYDQPERLQPAFQHLRFKGHDLIAFHVLDKNELG